MNLWQEIVAVVLVGASLAYVVRSVWRSLFVGRGCRCCKGCGVTSPALIKIERSSKKMIPPANQKDSPAGYALEDR